MVLRHAVGGGEICTCVDGCGPFLLVRGGAEHIYGLSLAAVIAQTNHCVTGGLRQEFGAT
ncbi:hypothetical protein CP981_31355 [Streptomyces platensis]|uniref:Uncharacterized protein n=1 Tax=Streptomyces platensis TaxID=58346 RepID=A0AAE6TQ20_STRPT|nr:hypothetical protein BG653_00711 [Streptomyces platensis]QEV55519.1 hypothetical protein CP981_31355 [Streptomyces platensis]